MKRFLILCAVAISLGGCAGTPAGDALRVATSTVTNPVQPVNIYQVKTVYSAVLEVADRYRVTAGASRSPRSWPTQSPSRFASIAAASCARSTMPTTRAHDAITRAEVFVRNNPTINAASVVREAWAAVLEFQRAAPVAAK
jgi:hypothetical protein